MSDPNEGIWLTYKCSVSSQAPDRFITISMFGVITHYPTYLDRAWLRHVERERWVCPRCTTSWKGLY